MNHSIWQLLAIAPTTDVRAIKRAYAKQLKTLAPDDRAAFIALRGAYEQALVWAADDVGVADDAPLDAQNRDAPHDDAHAPLDAQNRNAPHDDAHAPHLPSEPVHAVEIKEERAQAPDFLDACWDAWQACADDDALHGVLIEQTAAVRAADIATAMDYSDRLIHWFYASGRHAPLSFVYAAQVYDWRSLSDRRVWTLLDVYGDIDRYPALARWDANWRKGFWARLVQALHPGRRREAESDIARFWFDGYTEANLPAGVKALWAHMQPSGFFAFFLAGFLLSWILGLLFSIMHTPDVAMPLAITLWLYALVAFALHRLLALCGKASPRVRYMPVAGGIALAAVFVLWAGEAGRFLLSADVAAITAMAGVAVCWRKVLARYWFPQDMPERPRRWVAIVLFAAVAVLALRHPDNPAPWLFLLPMAGAYNMRLHLPVEQPWLSFQAACKARRQYVSTMLHCGLMLPFFGVMRETGAFAAMQGGAWLWLMGGYLCLNVYGLYAVSAYRKWRIALPMLAGMAAFALCVWMPVSGAALLHAYMVLFVALFSLADSPALVALVRSFAQCASAFCLPLLFWQQGWYGACAASLMLIAYVLWLDADIDEAMPEG